MIETGTSLRTIGGVVSSTATPSVPELRRRSKLSDPALVPPKDPKGAGSASDAVEDRTFESLSDQTINAIRPTLKTQNNCRPVRMRVSLERLQAAIGELDTAQDDSLLKTAHLILAEERLRVELLRQRLQMVLEG